MTSHSDSPTRPLATILETVQRCWGYDQLRPLQEEAIRAGLERRDALVVLPTGGGKSLCYQVPPLLTGRTVVVVSPLIALMKDQVDGLRACGYPAVALYGGLPRVAIRELEEEIETGRYRLVLAAPERLLAPGFLDLLERLRVGAFAVDEAHCISHWGHDFRKEYRQLAVVRRRFPHASVQAYTATATQRVRDDIVAQLGLRDPIVLVGCFDRPNLVYRVVPRADVYAQVLEVLERHPDEAAIVYCISRKDAEEMATHLQTAGRRAGCYHAGLPAEQRRQTQDAFSQERLDVIAATVAFGMGIDLSNVRCVIHAGMPKSIEHYQQETGRAGRDGLPAECVLFYSPVDALKWEGLIRRSAEEAGAPPEVLTAALALLAQMRAYCAVPECRHQSLSEYFGQAYDGQDCGACDVCLGEAQADSEATELAQKILSCVARVEQRFGVAHVVKVLRGANDKFVRHQRHDRLSTFGLLKELDPKALTNLVYELVEQGVLDRTPGDRPVLKLNAASWEILRGHRPVRLVRPTAVRVAPAAVEKSEGDGVDGALFESLRGLRREIAGERGVPAFVIFGDAALRDMARLRPATLAQFLQVHGVGARKLQEFGPRFVAHIETFLARGAISSAAPAPRPTAGAATAPDDGSAPTRRGAHPSRRGKSSPT